ncbi:MAG: beta-lactamase family protein [bacterium]|nr:beta-lactamase family protein [bacterium]
MKPAVPLHGYCDPRFSEVRGVFSDKLASDEVGASIAFTLNGESVVDLWGGYTAKPSEGHAHEWERDTIANTYSTTKGMTALIAHRLVEQGRIDLDAPVARYWPEFAQAGKGEVPVRWLLSHQVGLPAIRKTLPPEALYDWNAMCEALAETEPWWKPGSKHGYHPVTYGFLVGEVIRRVAGKSVGQLFREDVAQPLGADFHIGLPSEAHARVSDLIGSIAPPRSTAPAKEGQPIARIKGPLGDFMRDMADPTTMTGAAFNNPRIRAGAHNSPQWRQAEIPAANGHGNARALARIYGALACGGEVDGVRLLEPDSIARARTEEAEGPDATLGQLPMRYGLGFMLRSDFMPLSPNKSAFGHPGAGGSIGMADPDAGVGFGYVMNKMSMGLVGGPTGFAVLKAFYEAL